MHHSALSYFILVVVFARQSNYLDWWVANKVLIRSRGIWAGLCIKKMQNNISRIFVNLCCEASSVKYDIASLHFSSALSSPALLFPLVHREWWLALTSSHWANPAKLLLLENVQQLSPCQTEPLILQLVPVQRGIGCISSFVEGLTSDLGQAIGMDISEQHWRQGQNCTQEIFLAGYSY